MGGKLSEPQRDALRVIREWGGREGTYLPSGRQQNTMTALERRGLVTWVRHAQGFALTDAGRAVLGDDANG